MKKINCLALGLFLFISVGRSQGIELAFNHTALLVSDLERSVSFYKKIMFLEEIQAPGPLHRWFSLGEGVQLHLIKENKTVKLDKTIHLAFTTNDFDGFFKNCEMNQIATTNFEGDGTFGVSPATGSRNLFLQDPDNNWIEIREEVK